MPAGYPVVSLLPPENLKARFFVPEPSRVEFTPGTKVLVTIDGSSGATTGTVSFVSAQAEFTRANGTLTGKDRARQELNTFYSKVLAQDLSGARRLTYGRVQRLAQEYRLEYQSSRYEPFEERGSTLTKLKVSVELTGSYNSMRSFIHAIETAPQFVVIENISLAEGTGEGSLRLALDLSTYYRSSGR